MKSISLFFLVFLISFTSINSTAQKVKDSKSSTVKIKSGKGAQPLFVVDGVIMRKEFNSNTMNPSDIESITVLKDKNATTSYGDAGKNGVIEIITKKFKQTNGSKTKILKYNEESYVISCIYNKKLEESSFERTYKIEVEDNLSSLDLSLFGNIAKGIADITVINPDGKQVVPSTEMEDGGVMIDKTIKFDNGISSKGTWLIKVKTTKATGNYKIVFKGI